MPLNLKYLDGKKFCVVFLQADTPNPQSVKLRTIHGRANITREGALVVEHQEGGFFVPSSCYPQILPADGTLILGEAEYFVICRVSGMDL